jgi:hypothetical protein
MIDLKEVTKIPSFLGRVKYCNQHLTSLNKGSARRVYDLGNGNVLKLAMNPKGLAQNLVEADYILADLYPDMLNRCIDDQEDGQWIVTKKLEKVSIKQIEDYFGLGHKDLYSFLDKFTRYQIRQGTMPDFPFPSDPIKAELCDILYKICIDTHLLASDPQKRDSFGWDGDQNALKIIDFGLSKQVYIDHYLKKPESAAYGR